MAAAVESWNKNWKECLVSEQAYNEKSHTYIFQKPCWLRRFSDDFNKIVIVLICHTNQILEIILI